MASTTISLRTDTELKAQAEEILNQLVRKLFHENTLHLVKVLLTNHSLEWIRIGFLKKAWDGVLLKSQH